MNESIVRGERDGDALILSLTVDHLDAGNTAAFRAQATPLVQSVKRVVLDLTGVNFIDSAGLGALLSVMRNLGERNGDFRVCSASKAIKVLFELVRLHKVLDIHATRAEALAAGSAPR